jgi:hypothetical protein
MLSALKQSLASLVGHGTPPASAPATPSSKGVPGCRMCIPTKGETSSDFVARAAVLLESSDTLVYVDTSILMWLTKIGRTSRRQLFDWLAQNCEGRLFVPVWAAHEYLRHHVERTINSDLDEKADEIAKIAGAYAYLRPFLDDSLGNETATDQQVRARRVLTELEALAGTARKWKREYPVHAADVIEFINTHVPESTTVFDYMSEIEVLGEGRFSSRIPPGFQDRRKKEQQRTDDAGAVDGTVGSNRWGDLIFWKEVLDHARNAGARTIIILSNDRKNDWHLGGRNDEGGDPDLIVLRKDWKPLPRAHPMLRLEAQLAADVEEVMLLDAPYLGFILRKIAGDAVKAFDDVAIVPDPPRAPTEAERRKEKAEAEKGAREQRVATGAALLGFRFADSDKVALKPARLRRALLESRVPLPPEGAARALFEDINTAVASGTSVSDLLVKERLGNLDNVMLASVAREVHDRGIAGEPRYDEALADLVKTLDELPVATAASLYLGLIASMYLVRPDDDTRIPPRSPIIQSLFERQSAEYAALPIQALDTRMAKLERGPLYRLATDMPAVYVVLDHASNADGEVVLQGIRISGEQVVTLAQGNRDLRLANLFGERTEATGRELVERACSLFGVPWGQVQEIPEFAQSYALLPTIGSKAPNSVYTETEGVG